MIKLYKSLTVIKGKLFLWFLIFAVGIGCGVWLTNKVFAFGKINMLESYIDKQDASHRRTLKNVEAVHAKKLKIANDEIKIERVIEYVKDDRACDLSADAVRMLDNSRTGMSVPARRINAGTPELAAITQRQQVESCARDGIQYRQLKTDYDGLKQFVRDNWKQRHD